MMLFPRGDNPEEERALVELPGGAMGAIAAQDGYPPPPPPRGLIDRYTGWTGPREQLPPERAVREAIRLYNEPAKRTVWEGLTGQKFEGERYQTGPERAVRGALALPQRTGEASVRSSRDWSDYDPAPFVEAAMLPMAGTSFSAPAGAFGAGPALRRKAAMGDLADTAGPANKARTPVEAKGTPAEPGPKTPGVEVGEHWLPVTNRPFVDEPQRILKPGVYKRPDLIAKEANARVAPEHPAMKELFGVTRDDLYEISKQGTREGNAEPNIFMPKKPGSSYAAENIMNPANAQRLIDTLAEARKYPGLERGMVPWYVMDPAYQRLVQLVGPERAVTEYNRFNNMMAPFSASSDVMKEINRGTGARMMADRGEFEKFRRYNGLAEKDRGPDFPPEMASIISHPYHAIHTDPVARWLETGSHGYAKDTVKIPLYAQASGVPQTGFQTKWAVPDAHFTRAVGMSDTRKDATPGNYMGGPEYRTMAPWFREQVAKPAGLEAVPAQALTWGAYAPQTGVKTPIGAGKLELISQRMWERALELGVDPHWLRDKVLKGEQHSALPGGMGGVAAQDAYAIG